MSDIEDDELLLQVAGRSKPPARSLGRKRKRRSISISEDDDQDSDASEEGALDEDFEEAMAQRSRGPSEKGKKGQKAQEEKEVACYPSLKVVFNLVRGCVIPMRRSAAMNSIMKATHLAPVHSR